MGNPQAQEPGKPQRWRRNLGHVVREEQRGEAEAGGEMEAASPAKLRLFYVPPCISRDVPWAGTAVFLSKLCHAGIISMGSGR